VRGTERARVCGRLRRFFALHLTVLLCRMMLPACEKARSQPADCVTARHIEKATLEIHGNLALFAIQNTNRSRRLLTSVMLRYSSSSFFAVTPAV